MLYPRTAAASMKRLHASKTSWNGSFRRASRQCGRLEPHPLARRAAATLCHIIYTPRLDLPRRGDICPRWAREHALYQLLYQELPSSIISVVGHRSTLLPFMTRSSALSKPNVYLSGDPHGREDFCAVWRSSKHHCRCLPPLPLRSGGIMEYIPSRTGVSAFARRLKFRSLENRFVTDCIVVHHIGIT